MRKEHEKYAQDRLGNVRRELDEVRALGGMYEGNGIVDVEEEDTEEELVIFELPEGAEGVYIEELHAHNSGTEQGSFQLHSATMDDEGEIEEVVARSVPIVVSGEITRTVSYTGREFSKDAIVVTSEFEGSVGVGGYVDMPEYVEPASEHE